MADEEDSDSSNCPDFEDEELMQHEFEDWDLIHPQLQCDIKLFEDTIGVKAIEYNNIEDFAELKLQIRIPTINLKPHLSVALGLNHGEPIVVTLTLDSLNYLNTDWHSSRYEVCQKSRSTPGVATRQLKCITESFCKTAFQTLSNKIVANEIEKGRNISYLAHMGFSVAQVHRALAVTNGSKDQALEILLIENSCDALQICGSRSSTNEECVPWPSKDPPSLDKGFLVQLYRHLTQRLLTLTSYCPMCDVKHDLKLNSCLLPFVCNKDLCKYSYAQEYSCIDFINQHPKVFNLLSLLTEAAIFSPRMDSILIPFPVVTDGTKVAQVINEKEKNVPLLKEIVSSIPPIGSMCGKAKSEIKNIIDSRHKFCYSLIQWIVESKDIFFVSLPRSKLFKFIHTNHQFITRSLTLSCEETFAALKHEHGSFFAFHGSPLENWHAIIREGLIVASGTEKQVHGAAMGKGIYLTTVLQMAIEYCRSNSQNPIQFNKVDRESSSFGDYIQRPLSALQCIALCEVIHSPDLINHGPVYVAPCKDYVCIRFLFVYDGFNPYPFKLHGAKLQNQELMQIQQTIDVML